ncbi:MAG: type II secretion system F family protein [Syntrophaceae bacterium]|nr:type II secretion system F family protein [Syntrophaceae bacterium]
MPKFSYRAITENGTKQNGIVEADTIDVARNILLARGYIPSSITDGNAAISGDLWTRIKEGVSGIKITDLIIFTKQFRSMLLAGIPVLRLLQVLENQTENLTMKRVVGAIAQDIRQGFTLYEAMEKHPSVFSRLYCSMVRAGEISGTIPDVLERLIYIIEHEAKIKADIRSALRYPMIVLFALGAAFVVLLTFVIPKFVAIFMKAGVTLPIPTRISMILYKFLSDQWYFIIGGTIIIIFALRAYFKTWQGKFVRDTFFLRLPLFGPLFIKAAMSRFASIFAILQSSGVPIINSMSILSETIGNVAISKEFDLVREKVEEGAGISTPLRSAKYFPPMVIDMVAIGEETGNIEDMLRQISIHYDDEVEYAVKGLSDALGPILIVGLAAVVGFFALSIFLPMWDLTKTVK